MRISDWSSDVCSSDLPLQFQTQAADSFQDLAQWMLSHLDSDLSIASLAARANLGTRHFSRRFKTVFGQTPAEFVTAMRLSEARRRLTLPRGSVERVAGDRKSTRLNSSH